METLAERMTVILSTVPCPKRKEMNLAVFRVMWHLQQAILDNSVLEVYFGGFGCLRL